MPVSLNELASHLTSAPVYIGYAASGAQAPFAVLRPIIINPIDIAISGAQIDWDGQYGLYCAAESVEASYNLALLMMRQLAGKRLPGGVATVSMGYGPSLLEGLYETQVTIQFNQGGI